MSTHASIVFGDIAIYRHADGYPSVTGEDLVEFIYQCSLLEDSKFYDLPYLAAKYVVWLAHQFAKYDFSIVKQFTAEEYEKPQCYLNFSCLGIETTKNLDGVCDYTYVIGNVSNINDIPVIVCYEGSTEIKTYDMARLIEEKNNKVIKKKII